MSHPPHGPPPPYYTGHGHPPPPPGGSYAYVATPVMMPVYQPPPPPSDPTPPGTYVTNYIYHQPPQPLPVVTIVEEIHVQPPPPPSYQWSSLLRDGAAMGLASVNKGLADLENNLRSRKKYNSIEWIPATPSDVSSLSNKAFIAGKEGWDNSPLCIIRAHHSGELIPGKLALKHRVAYVPHSGQEVPVHNFEVLCCPPHAVHWLPSNNGQVPVGAIAAGNSHKGEPLYIGRVNQMGALTPGKVHPSHGCCYISFSGSEVSHKSYEVLCKIVG